MGRKEENKSNRRRLVNGKRNNSDQDKDSKDNAMVQYNDNTRTHNSDNQAGQRTSSKSPFIKEKVSRPNWFQTRKIGSANSKSNSDNTRVTHNGPTVNNLIPVIEKNEPNFNDTHIRNDEPNIDDTNIRKNGRPPYTVEFSVLIAVILILALFILPCCLYKAKIVHAMSRRDKLAPSQTYQSTISQISTGVPSWQPREAMSEVYVL